VSCAINCCAAGPGQPGRAARAQHPPGAGLSVTAAWHRSRSSTRTRAFSLGPPRAVAHVTAGVAVNRGHGWSWFDHREFDLNAHFFSYVLDYVVFGNRRQLLRFMHGIQLARQRLERITETIDALCLLLLSLLFQVFPWLQTILQPISILKNAGDP
jgi:hypothetical protein